MGVGLHFLTYLQTYVGTEGMACFGEARDCRVANNSLTEVHRVDVFSREQIGVRPKRAQKKHWNHWHESLKQNKAVEWAEA